MSAGNEESLRHQTKRKAAKCKQNSKMGLGWRSVSGGGDALKWLCVMPSVGLLQPPPVSRRGRFFDRPSKCKIFQTFLRLANVCVCMYEYVCMCCVCVTYIYCICVCVCRSRFVCCYLPTPRVGQMPVLNNRNALHMIRRRHCLFQSHSMDGNCLQQRGGWLYAVSGSVTLHFAQSYPERVTLLNIGLTKSANC